ncbi:MAG: helix-turn-helix transcriptional regulator [Candidatus Heimdallarchaeota archaeon]|nr:helix-turn-helix transcriptional regulator [Candidatus Heimdallarchaeota archaeon]
MDFKEDPVLKIISLFSKKWTYEIISLLIIQGDCRYSDFEKAYPDLSSKMLSTRLKELFDSKLISKVISKLSPLDFKYRLSDRGSNLRHVLREMAIYGTQVFNINNNNYSFDEIKKYYSQKYEKSYD